MNRNYVNYGLITTAIMFAMTVTGCGVVKGIFKAGVWIGVIIVVVILLVVGMIFRGIRK